ncbi:serine hydrolase [Umezawaea beigongshangensis]|uniref:serine hydrolase n=1 Tax=Umezawaea beigongshangensis TaxID=2780383 RepID=UPI0018F11B01|nr:serine hydrolase [Umezawaea beigongshangensis]
MLFTRRRALAAGAVVSGSLLLDLPHAAASDRGSPRDWPEWFATHRDQVAVALDDGAGGRIVHRQHAPLLLASTVKVVHAAAYSTAVRRGLVSPDEPVRVGDWEAYYAALDGGAHQSALTLLGVPFTNGVTADDPEHRVRLADLAEVMIRCSDNAATDYLRNRLGEPALRRAAAEGGWPQPDLRSLLGEVLMLVLPDRAPPPGAPAAVRRATGLRLEQRFLRDPQFQLEVVGRFPEVPRTYDEQARLVLDHGRGAAADLRRMHASVAAGRFPVARDVLELEHAEHLPDGVAGIGFKGGSLPSALGVGFGVRWRDGRTGSAAVLLSGVDEAWFGRSGELVALVRDALLDPEVRRAVAAGLVA